MTAIVSLTTGFAENADLFVNRVFEQRLSNVQSIFQREQIFAEVKLLKENPYNLFPEWVSAEALERVFSRYTDGEFVFELPKDGFSETVRGTTYHVVPHYADEDAEDIVSKLRRIMASELPKD